MGQYKIRIGYMLIMILEDQGVVLEDGRFELKGRNFEIYFLKM